MRTNRHFPEAADLLQVSLPHAGASSKSSDVSRRSEYRIDRSRTCSLADAELLRLTTETLQLIRQLRI
ncbi:MULTISPECIES: hypothetical protein [unclassified Thioalkalivibrio]|uniref:hypothetical protein n=1 Tax=unclassified Thioalkalivibrio TaxID=2621013 RepID=UPI0012DE4FAC|nr:MULTISPECIES: hypothetical protein [unclassified Thioalkalivibrio]